MQNPNTPASPGTDDATRQMSRGVGVALLVVAIVGIGAFIGTSMASAKHDQRDAKMIEVVAADDAATRAALTKALGEDDGDYHPRLNTAGDHVFNTAYVNDATGVVTTPNDAGVFTVIKASPLTAGDNDGSGCITFSATTGLFTVAARCGVGELELQACIADFASSSNTADTTTIKWEANGAAITASSVIRKTEPVDAGNGRSSIGCVGPVLYNAALNDTLGVYVANGAGGITGTTRSAAFRVIKFLNK